MVVDAFNIEQNKYSYDHYVNNMINLYIYIHVQV